MRAYGDRVAKELNPTIASKESRHIWEFWDSEALHVELSIIIWRRTKYLLEGHDENENDAEFFSRKLSHYDLSPGGQMSTYQAHSKENTLFGGRESVNTPMSHTEGS